MRFAITLNLGSKGNERLNIPSNIVHQVIGNHPAKDIKEFMDEAMDRGYVIVKEVYRHAETGEWFPVGDIALNATVIGKVKIMN